MKRSLAACLDFKAGEINSAKTEIIGTEIIHGRSALTYLPLSQEKNIPELFLENVGCELGGSTEIFWISNVFIKDGIVYGSGFFPKIHSRGTIESRDSFADSIIEKLEVNIILNEPSFLVTAHRSGHAFYHFMIDYLPRQSVIEKSSKPSLPFLFSPCRLDFQYQAMDLLIKQIYPIHNMSKGVLLRECAIMTPLSKVDAVDFLRDRSAHVMAAGPAKRLYISRRYALSRRVVNEDELAPILRKYKFQIIHCEQMNLEAQIATFKSAEFVCAPHGAGLANIVYCEKRTSILEIIIPERFPLGALFWELACAADLDYHILTGTRVPIYEADMTNGDIYVEPDKLEAALSYMVERKG